MINANELRVNNWYRQLHTGKESQVTLFLLGEISDDESYLDHLFPIQLSPEVLLACGFRKDSEYRFSRELPIGNGSDIEVSYDPFFDEWEITLENGKNEFFPESIKSLHQLQNLYFALTGKELEYSQIK